MIKYMQLLLLLLFLSNSQSFAGGIDKVFITKSTDTWGEIFKKFFGLTDFNKSHALVIGISNYKHFNNLGTSDDPIRMKNFLLNEAGFDSVRVITNDQVNINKIRKLMMEEYPNRILKKNDRFLFYWSGHGITDKGNNHQDFGYLPTFNSQKDQFASMLSMKDLSIWDRKLKAKQTLYLLDSCFSGLAGIQTMSTQRNLTIEQIARPSRQILTAGLENEEAIVIEGIGSVFTAALIDGLRGKADTKTDGFNKDGIISARELELYVKKRVAKERAKVGWNKSMTPLLTRLTHAEGDFFFFSKNGLREEAPIAVKNRKVKPKSGNNTNTRFVDNNNGTVTDNKTGLIWQKCNVGQSGNNCKGKSIELPWFEALNEGKNGWRLPTIDELKGLIVCTNGVAPQNDWSNGCMGNDSNALLEGKFRVPTIDPIFTNNVIWPIGKKEEGFYETRTFWSSTTVTPSTDNDSYKYILAGGDDPAGWAMRVDFVTGSTTGLAQKGFDHHVKLVKDR